jgi:FkbM family methyltransferase
LVEEKPEISGISVGCAIGIMSVVSLFASEQSEVIAFDSDLASLKATERMCQYANGNRLQIIYGFISENHLSELEASAAFAATQKTILASGVTGDSGTTAYVCIDGNNNSNIPTHSLDKLLLENGCPDQPVLLKCDVESAELLVLRGAKQLLQNCSPTLLLSVHPPALPNYGQSVQEVRDYLNNLGYSIQVLSVDHEEHWWCEK